MKDKETCSGRIPCHEINKPVPTDKKLSDGQYADHWVLSEEERSKGFIRPVRRTYIHEKCRTTTTMPQTIAETYAARPDFYGSTFCCHCGGYYPVGPNGEFVWLDNPDEKVGS